MENIEIWRDIIGYEGIYQVSNYGLVRSLDRLVLNGTGKKPIKGAIKKHSTQREGYVFHSLYIGGHGKKHYTHRLVAIAFIENPNGLPQVNHKNGNKMDNKLGNLEWVSASDNCKHAIDTGLYERVRGESTGMAKVTEKDVVEMRRMVACGAMHKEAAAMFGIGRKAVTKIVNRQRWQHVP